MYTLTDTHTGMSTRHETLTDVAGHLPTLFAGTPVEPQAHAYADMLRTGHTDNAYEAYLGITIARED